MALEKRQRTAVLLPDCNTTCLRLEEEALSKSPRRINEFAEWSNN